MWWIFGGKEVVKLAAIKKRRTVSLERPLRWNNLKHLYGKAVRTLGGEG